MREKQGENRGLPKGLEPRHSLGLAALKTVCSGALPLSSRLPNLQGEQRFINWAKIRS